MKATSEQGAILNLMRTRMTVETWHLYTTLNRWVTRASVRKIFQNKRAVTRGNVEFNSPPVSVWEGSYVDKKLTIGCVSFDEKETKKIRKWALS